MKTNFVVNILEINDFVIVQVFNYILFRVP